MNKTQYSPDQLGRISSIQAQGYDSLYESMDSPGEKMPLEVLGHHKAKNDRFAQATFTDFNMLHRNIKAGSLTPVYKLESARPASTTPDHMSLKAYETAAATGASRINTQYSSRSL